MISFDFNTAYEILRPLTVFVIGMVVYSIFIFKFYRFLARRDIFDLDLNQYNRYKDATGVWLKNLFKLFFYLAEYIFIFPLFVFFWFLVLVVLLAFLSKNQSLDSILLVAMALVVTIRITAYYSEDLSKDLAKMMPFALLGVFLVDVSFFSFSSSWEVILSMKGMIMTLIYYLLFVVALEFVLRILYGIYALLFKQEDEEDKVALEQI
jgi:hypothetical protein